MTQGTDSNQDPNPDSKPDPTRDTKASMNRSESETYVLMRWIFMRLIGVIYFDAFFSAGVQIVGLIGKRGILPAADLLTTLYAQAGSASFNACPTIFWFNVSDQALTGVCFAGVILSVLLIVGLLAQPILLLLWILYLSIVAVGGDFMSFQWDVLLLEVGFLSIFFSHLTLFDAPWAISNKWIKQVQPSLVCIWLLRILLFKLMFMSGCVKLGSHDPTWRNLTALDYHYWTQPLPTPVAWYAALLPGWFQKLSVLIMFAIELGVPFLIFGLRQCRYVAFFLICGLQALIALTGNYTFFNLLTMTLCLTLLDDDFLHRFLPAKAMLLKVKLAQPIKLSKPAIQTGAPEPLGPLDPLDPIKLPESVGVVESIGIMRVAKSERFGKLIEYSLACLIGVLTSIHLVPALAMIPAVGFVQEVTAPFCLVNTYGLFAVMTTSRHEIVVEGSDDLIAWKQYEFPFKPQDLKNPPPWVAPYQPRLDWQMWFAALGPSAASPWFRMFMYRLLQGSPDVLTLLKVNPFPAKPPKYVRSSLYDYHFSTAQEHDSQGAWWRRSYLGTFSDPMTLRRE